MPPLAAQLQMIREIRLHYGVVETAPLAKVGNLLETHSLEQTRHGVGEGRAIRRLDVPLRNPLRA